MTGSSDNRLCRRIHWLFTLTDTRVRRVLVEPMGISQRTRRQVLIAVVRVRLPPRACGWITLTPCGRPLYRRMLGSLSQVMDSVFRSLALADQRVSAVASTSGDWFKAASIFLPNLYSVQQIGCALQNLADSHLVTPSAES